MLMPHGTRVSVMLVPVLLLLLSADSASAAGTALPKADAKQAQRVGHLKTSAGGSALRLQQQQKEKHLDERVKDEIKVAAQKFMQGNEQVLKLPLEIDVLLLGFDGDGSYGYKMDTDKLEELLAASLSQKALCPHVWDSGQSAMLCYEVNYLTMVEGRSEQTLIEVEAALKGAMKRIGDRSQEWEDGSKETQVYEIEATEVEGVLKRALDVAVYGVPPGGRVGRGGASGESTRGATRLGAGAAAWHEVRPAVILMNPHKRRMSPVADAAQAAAAGGTRGDVIKAWQSGKVSVPDLVAEEGGYVYRYKYNNRGSAATWLSQHNFLVIDIAAGPAAFGPLSSLSGRVMPGATPRLLPMLTRMAKEIESQPAGTLHSAALEAAAAGEHALLLGQLAAALVSATTHVFAPDLRTERIEYATRVLVPVIVLQDHHLFDPLDPQEHPDAALDMLQVQDALDSLLGPDQEGVATASRHFLHHHPQLAAALHRARSTTCKAMLPAAAHVQAAAGQGDGEGGHNRNWVHIDSAALFEELRHAADTLVQALVEDPEYESSPPSPASGATASGARHNGTRVVPVFVFSLRDAPDQMLLDNRQLVAADHHAIIVLQLLGRGGDKESDKPTVWDPTNATHEGAGRLYSGHMQEGRHLMLDAAESPTRSVVAGLASALGGVVPPYQRFDKLEGRIVEDWRWAVGAQPWGPYSNSAAVSHLLSVAAQRASVFSHLEVALRQLQKDLGRVDAFVADNLQGPFADIAARLPPKSIPAWAKRKHASRMRRPPPAPGETDAAASHPRLRLATALNPHRHWLNRLSGVSIAYGNGSTAVRPDAPEGPVQLGPDVVQRINAALGFFEKLIQELGYMLYSSDWQSASGAMVRLLAEADAFTLMVDLDLERAQQVLACCQLRHVAASYSEVYVLIAFLGLCCAFVALMAVGAVTQATRASQGRKEAAVALPSWVLPRHQAGSRHRN